MMRQYPPVLILRHGETEWNAAGRLQGHFDSPLTKTGIRQAQAQRSYLAALDLSGYRAFSSPQRRATHTAAIALAGLVQKIETDPRLAEIGVGKWAGRYLRDLASEHLSDPHDATGVYEQAPDGEGFAALHARCEEFLVALEDPAVIVTHGMTARMLRMVLLGEDRSMRAAIPDAQGVIYHIKKGSLRVVSVGA